MLKLLRRKSFRKSKDLDCDSPGPGGSAVRERRLQSTHSLSQSRDNVKVLRSRYSSLSNTTSEDNPPEIIQYARPPENLASPVRESNSYLPESVLNSKQECETTIQKLFFDSVVNNTGGQQRSRSEARRSVTGREGGHTYSRRSSSNNNNAISPPTNKVVKQEDPGLHSGLHSKVGRRSVLSVLRQSFRRPKKERAPASLVTHRARHVSQSSSVEDQTSISVASVRTVRTLTPSRASIVSRTSLADRESPGDNNNLQSMKTATAPPAPLQATPRQLSSKPSYTSTSSSSSNGASSSSRVASEAPATPRHGGATQRFLPETPKLVGSPSAVPPIYANVHQQLAAGGNNRQISPGIAKILEDSGNIRQENGVARTPSSSQVPPSIPKPAARLSIRQKVEFQRVVLMVLIYHKLASAVSLSQYSYSNNNSHFECLIANLLLLVFR